MRLFLNGTLGLKVPNSMSLINFLPKNWDYLSLDCRWDEILIMQIVPCTREIYAVLGDGSGDYLPVVALALIDWPGGTDVVCLILSDIGVEIAEIDFLDGFKGFGH